MNNAKHKWIGKAISIALTVVFVGAILFGLFTIAQNDKNLPPEDDTVQETFTLDRVELGETVFDAVAQNDSFTLLADLKNGEIAVEDRTTGHIWYSNPQDRANDTLAYDQTVLASQILVNYLNVEGNLESQIGSLFGSAQVSALTAKTVENGVSFTFEFPEFGFTVPLTYRLQKDGFTAEIDASAIQESNSAQYKLMSIDVLPFYGVGGLADEGYLFVPDGSGALINYNNGRETAKIYNAPVYGNDAVIQQDQQTGVSQTVRMPVFGLKTNDVASFSVITSGESLGEICASVSGRTNNYNQAYARMIYRRREITTVNKGTRTYKMSMYTDCLLTDEPFTVRYFMLYGDDADYSGMARRYRQYLTENGLVNRSELAGTSALLVDLYGAVHKEEDEFSIKAASTLPLTTYAQMTELHKTLQAAGVDTILNIKGWATGGLGDAAPDTVKPEKVLGGEKAFAELRAYLQEQKVTAFFEHDFQNLYRDSAAYTGNRDGIKLLVGASAYQYRYHYDDYLKDLTSRWYLLTPSGVQDAVSRFTATLSDTLSNVAVSGLGSTLYSDYNPNSYMTRSQAQTMVENGLSALDEAFGMVLTPDANAYAFKTASLITDAPVAGSSYDITDAAVPFYQMVLHGLIPMSVPSGNLSSDNHFMYLKAIETGCNLKYSWIASDPKTLVNTAYNNLFGVGFEEWFDEAVAQYTALKTDMADLYAQQIVHHETVADNVFKTTYESGTCVIVNYNDYAVDYNGTSVAAQQYAVLKGEGEQHAE